MVALLLLVLIVGGGAAVDAAPDLDNRRLAVAGLTILSVLLGYAVGHADGKRR